MKVILKNIKSRKQLQNCPLCHLDYNGYGALATHIRITHKLKFKNVLVEYNIWPKCKNCNKPTSRLSTCSCSQKCATEFDNKNNREKRICIICKAQFETSKNSTRKLCNIKCNGKYLSLILKGKKLNLTKEQKEHRSKNVTGKNNPFYGKKHSQKTINNITEKIIQQKICNGQWYSIGKNEKQLLDLEEQKIGFSILRQHQVGRFVVDGYCKELNRVIEVYENFHNKQIQKDLNREIKICDRLNCEFHIIWDNDTF